MIHQNQTTLGAVVIRIDSQNIYYDVKRFRETRPGFCLNYEALVRRLAAGRHVIRTVYYRNLPERMSESEQRFIKGLKDQGFHMVVPHILPDDHPRHEKGTDAAIAAHLVQYARPGRTEVLVSGDGDFRIPVLEAKARGARIEVAAFRASLSQKLAAVAHQVIVLDDIMDELAYAPRRQPVTGGV